MRQINIKLLEKMFQSTTSSRLIKNALKMYIPRGKYKKRIIGENIFCLIPTILIGISLNTQQLFLNGMELINNSIMAIFGIVFTGYALFQAFINDELLLRMINEPDLENKDMRNKLQETNETFTELMMLCVISIVTNVYLNLIISSLPENFLVFEKMAYNNIFAMVLMQIYFVFNSNIFLELKSFIFNTFQLFNLHAGTKVIQIMQNKEGNDD